MNTLEMLKNVRDFVISNRNTGTSSLLVNMSRMVNAHILTSGPGMWEKFHEVGTDIDNPISLFTEKKPVLIDNGALKEILDRAIKEIEKLKNENEMFGKIKEFYTLFNKEVFK